MKNVPEIFGSMVFNDSVMKERLPGDTYKSLKKIIAEGSPLELSTANVVANAMKDWAIEKGVTHFTHWFQPMTGVTAEKHDSFISPAGDGKVIMEFSGKELIKGEPDASSFPSGGLRATFEARGYTAWDLSSFAFIKDNTLCIPTAFCAYNGQALDQKTPLLRSIEAVNKQALRLLRILGDTETRRVFSSVGPEQEYFLIDSDMYDKRPDLILTGHTLFGARPPKGQELDDHYFGALKPRVAAFMAELDEELWKMGVNAKTEHNEVAPGQHELAVIYTTANLACDQNQITMELAKRIAAKYHMACLLHEKPFAGVNGSGKHNNWSLTTDTGINLFEPGKTPSHNERFLLFVAATIQAVDEYSDLLRVSVASAGNDHRLGASEAPPAIVSMFLGDELTELLLAIEHDDDYEDKEKSKMRIGAHVLPYIHRDTTDRNRTSPFAFTGNKFEFRMPGSSFSLSCPNMVLNTIAAESLRQFADRLEASADLPGDIRKLVKETVASHERIIFNGNNYAAEWVEEAARRGLPNLCSTVDALPHFMDEKNVALFERHKVFTREEMSSRYEILLENYSKRINIEALTMIDMVSRSILPAVLSCEGEYATLAGAKKALGGISAATETDLLERISKLADCMAKKLDALEKCMLNRDETLDGLAQARFYREKVLVTMTSLRGAVDELESVMPAKYWPYPTYAEMLYSVK